MNDLALCPSCVRHVRPGAPCPFCGAPTDAARPGPLRKVTRRELTRAAIFAGAAVLAGACGGPEIVYDDEEASSGGDEPRDESFAHDADDGSARDARVTDEERARRAQAAREEELRRQREEELRRQRELEEDYRYERRRPRCTPEGICPPYGAPAIPDVLV